MALAEWISHDEADEGYSFWMPVTPSAVPGVFANYSTTAVLNDPDGQYIGIHDPTVRSEHLGNI